MSDLVPGCGVPNATVYPMADGSFGCRCLVCSRCGKHTGNNTQGHYWAFCSVTKSVREFHFCCPGDCELMGDGYHDPGLAEEADCLGIFPAPPRSKLFADRLPHTCIKDPDVSCAACDVAEDALAVRREDR